MPNRRSDKQHLEAEFSRAIVSPSTDTIFDAAGILSRLCPSPMFQAFWTTALVHAAACVRTPVVGLYRADKDHYARFSPYLIPNRMVISKSNLVEDISVDQVMQDATDLLAELGTNG